MDQDLISNNLITDLLVPISYIGLAFGITVGFTFGFIGRLLTKSEQLINYFGLGRR